MGRVMRGPSHTWNVRAKPWQLQPVAIAPVLPGETMKNAVLQARVVTDPVKNRLMGWWHEYYVYYVPFRAMDGIQAELEKMVTEPDWDAVTAGITSNTANPQHGFGGRNSINWMEHCLKAIVEHDFRNEGEAWDLFMLDGLPMASINRTSWADSLTSDAVMAEYDVEVDADEDGVITASEVQVAMQQYELLKTNGLIQMEYEDFLKTYGIRGKAVQKAEEVLPELLRYVRDWQYPSNTVGSDGSVSTAVSWSMAERIDKDRFFKEPGFLVTLTCSRPKVFLGNQVGSAAMVLDDIRSWLPAVMVEDPYTSLKQFASGAGPMTEGFDQPATPTPTTDRQGYWMDVRDIFLHGDQFVNNADAYKVALPNIDGRLQYASSADVAGLFPASATKTHIEQDGLITFAIAGTQRDHTATVNKAVLV